jgi:hypothetical protein
MITRAEAREQSLERASRIVPPMLQPTEPGIVKSRRLGFGLMVFFIAVGLLPFASSDLMFRLGMALLFVSAHLLGAFSWRRCTDIPKLYPNHQGKADPE